MINYNKRENSHSTLFSLDLVEGIAKGQKVRLYTST